MSVAVVIEAFDQDFPVFGVELRHAEAAHHAVHLVQRESPALEEVPHHFLLNVKLCQFEVFEQLMQLRHFHLLPTKQPLQFLPVAGSFALTDLLA